MYACSMYMQTYDSLCIGLRGCRLCSNSMLLLFVERDITAKPGYFEENSLDSRLDHCGIEKPSLMGKPCVNRIYFEHHCETGRIGKKLVKMLYYVYLPAYVFAYVYLHAYIH